MTHNLTLKLDSLPSLTYTDKQVVAAIKAAGQSNSYPLLLKHFFTEVHEYALATWRKKYNRLKEADWEIILSNSDLKLVSRLKKGLVLKKSTKLKTYYAGIVDYAALDYVTLRKKEATFDIPVKVGVEDCLPTFEKKELAVLLREKLEEITGNKEQVQVLLLYAKGYSYKEVVQKTSYLSEGACRNAFLKAKKKIALYITTFPEEGKRLRELIVG